MGCVYTAQGFEYDWDGVIFGPDLVYRDGRLVTVARGMMGTALYSVDPETQEFLSGLFEAGT